MKLTQIIRHKFLRDTSILQAGALLVAGGNFITAVGLSHLLGARQQGEFYVAIALYSFLWFTVNLGLVAVSVSKISAALARKEPGEATAWLAYLFKAYLVLGIGVALVGSQVLPYVAEHWLGSSANVGRMAVLLACMPLIELPRIVACAGLQATRRMLPLAQVENGQEFVRAFLVLIGALVTGDLTGPVVGTLVAGVVGSVLAVDLYLRECKKVPELLPGPVEILRHVRDVPLSLGLSLGVRMGAVQNLNALGMQILPSLLLQTFGDTKWVAYLRIAQRIMNVPMMLMQAISRSTLPMFSEFAGVKDMARMCRAYFRASLFSGLLIGAGVALFMPFLPWLLDLTFPPEYLEPVWTICLILVPGFLVMSFSIANDTFYLVTGTLRVGIIFSVVGMAINTTAVGVLAWMYPTVGVAWGMMSSMCWSAWHPAYAYYWYRKNVLAGDGGGKPLEPSDPAAVEPAEAS